MGSIVREERTVGGDVDSGGDAAAPPKPRNTKRQCKGTVASNSSSKISETTNKNPLASTTTVTTPSTTTERTTANNRHETTNSAESTPVVTLDLTEESPTVARPKDSPRYDDNTMLSPNDFAEPFAASTPFASKTTKRTPRNNVDGGDKSVPSSTKCSSSQPSYDDTMLSPNNLDASFVAPTPFAPKTTKQTPRKSTGKDERTVPSSSKQSSSRLSYDAAMLSPNNLDASFVAPTPFAPTATKRSSTGERAASAPSPSPRWRDEELSPSRTAASFASETRGGGAATTPSHNTHDHQRPGSRPGAETVDLTLTDDDDDDEDEPRRAIAASLRCASDARPAPSADLFANNERTARAKASLADRSSASDVARTTDERRRTDEDDEDATPKRNRAVSSSLDRSRSNLDPASPSPASETRTPETTVDRSRANDAGRTDDVRAAIPKRTHALFSSLLDRSFDLASPSPADEKRERREISGGSDTTNDVAKPIVEKQRRGTTARDATPKRKNTPSSSLPSHNRSRADFDYVFPSPADERRRRRRESLDRPRSPETEPVLDLTQPSDDENNGRVGDGASVSSEIDGDDDGDELEFVERAPETNKRLAIPSPLTAALPPSRTNGRDKPDSKDPSVSVAVASGVEIIVLD